MTSSGNPKDDKLPSDEQDLDKNRRQNERRQTYSEGYTYISMVGWICRREKKRRKENGQSG